MSSTAVTITVDRVDVALLRRQRDALLAMYTAETPVEIDGLVSLLDHMLDVADGEVGPDRGWGST